MREIYEEGNEFAEQHRRFNWKIGVQLASSVESQAKTTGGSQLESRHVSDVEMSGHVARKGLVFSSGLLQV